MVILGTPFPVNSDRDKFVPAWKQEARDEQGRKRFHGAFTGGFTAGYHNTVGSREGWIPSQFISSKTRRATVSRVAVEDFMDDEDLRELSKTSKLIINPQYQEDDGGTGSLRGKDSGLGWMILKRMGWKGDNKLPTSLVKLLDRLALVEGEASHEDELRAAHGLSVLEEIDPEEDVYGDSRKSIPLARNVGRWDAWQELRKFSASRGRRMKSESAGFMPAEKETTYQEINYPPIIVPADWVESIQTRKTPVSTSTRPVIRDIEQRGHLLGEITRLASISTLEHYSHPKLDPITAMNAQKGFMPYSTNPLKKSRYEQLLNHFINPQVTLLPKPLPRQSREEYFRELDEYVKAAYAFKPLPATMASRFKSASPSKQFIQPEAIPLSKGGLHIPVKDLTSSTVTPTTTNENLLPVGKSLSTKKVPYGKETHSECPWNPSPILCQKLGLEPPAIQFISPTDTINKSTPKAALCYERVRAIVAESSFADKVNLSNLKDINPEEEDHSMDEPNETLQYIPSELLNDADRPGMDLFRSIFGEAEETIEKVDKEKDEDFIQSSDIIKKSVHDSTLSFKESKIPMFSQAPVPRIKPSFTAVAEEGEGKDETDTIIIKKKRPAAADLW